MFSKPGRVAGAALVAAAVFSTLQVAGADTHPIVTLSNSKFPQVHHVEAGDYFGASPGVVHVRVGDSVTFVNDDSKHHTATGISGADSFVADPRWTDSALQRSGSIGSGDWSTGDLAPGKSATVVAAKPGTYYWGCFFEYSAGMRGQIIVER